MNMEHNLNDIIKSLSNTKISSNSIVSVKSMNLNIRQLPNLNNLCQDLFNISDLDKDNNEENIKNCLINNGFTEVKLNNENKTLLKKIIHRTIPYDNIEIVKEKLNMVNYSFIHQPFGIQSNPDFVINILDKKILLSIEAKSNKSCTPMYNNGIPDARKNYLNCFTSRKCNQTTMYFSSDILSKEEYDIIESGYKKSKLIEAETNRLLREYSLSTNRGINLYLRKSSTHTVGNDSKINSNYFTHPDRQRCEDNVKTYFNDLNNLIHMD